MPASRGIVAAGHPLTAEAGARVLRAGGNAVDAALGAMLTSFVCEPLLTGLGAGGYMLVVPPGEAPVVIDFFVEAPGRGGVERRAELVAVDVDFGDTVQVFHVGAAAVGTYGTPAGIAHASRRFGTVPLGELAPPAAELAFAGVEVNRQQAHIAAILAAMIRSTPEAEALYRGRGGLVAEGDRWLNEDLGHALLRLGDEGAAPFYTGDVAAAASDWVLERGGTLTREDLAAYEPVEREPVHVRYRERDVVTNPPPNSGGILVALALGLLDRTPGPPTVERLVEVMGEVQGERTVDFLDHLAEPGFAGAFMSSRLGSTTHISAIDADGWACSVTASNGVGSGLVVPGTGLHLNNMLGEQDLNPHGFHRHPPGRRLPSMMAPTAVLRDGEVELVVGSAGSNRIRSAILQVVCHVVDDGLPAGPAVEAPRVHFEDGVVYAEPGVDTGALERAGLPVQRFSDRNVFFGGAQAVQRDPSTGALSGGGDPRRGGAVVVA